MPPERRGLRPRPPGAAPPAPAVPSALWGGTPLLLTSRERRQAIGGKRVCKTMGEAPEVGAPKARKPRVSRWATRRVVHGPPEGRAGARKPPPRYSAIGAKPRQQGSKTPAPRGGSFLAQQGIVSTPFPLKCRPPWPTKSSSASPSSRASATSLPPSPTPTAPARNAQRCYRAGRPEHAQPQQSGRGHAGPERPSPREAPQ